MLDTGRRRGYGYRNAGYVFTFRKMSFQSLFDIGPVAQRSERRPHKSGVTGSTPARATKKAQVDERGCSACPLNKIEGVKKILGKVTGKQLLVVAQSPGPEENKVGKELIGPSGKFLWDELAKVGIKRSDCDIQNVVRCFPCNAEEGSYETYLKMRSPTQKEIKCCSIHTENALSQSQAKCILVLGQVAAKALLNTRSAPTQKIFYSEQLKARVYLVDHPSFFIRGYGQGPRLDSFRQTLKKLKQDLDGDTDISDPYTFIKKQDYQLITNFAQAEEANYFIRHHAAKGRRIACDIEYHDDSKTLICCGFSPQKGQSYVFVFSHRDQNPKDGQLVWAVAKLLLEDPEIQKAFQHGVSDITKLKELAGIEVQGFTHDSHLSEYLRFSDRDAYGLEAIASVRFQDFIGYAQIITEDLSQGIDFPKKVINEGKQYDYLFKKGLADYRKISLDNLRLYNGADCDLTKRIEVENKKHVPQALMNLYIDLSFILYEMEPNGPEYDYQHHRLLEKYLPHQASVLKKELQDLINDPEFNPASPEQVYDVIYERLGLEYPFHKGKPNTQKKTLLMLGREHPFPKKMVAWRKAAKGHSTIESYKNCADLNNGRLRTRWWATGARTGRLRSGGKKEDPGVINLQNVHKDWIIRNLCVFDTRWRDFYKAAKEIVSRGYDRPKTETALEQWVRSDCPDLKTGLVLDYGQIEVRVAAQISGDKNLRKDCQESDIHTKVGVTMTGWPAEKIKNDEQTRTVTKNVHFGILFGISRENLYDFVVAMTDPEQQDTISREQVYEAYDNYFKRYPGIRQYQESQREFAAENGYVETMFGMRQLLNVTQEFEHDDGYFDDEGTDSRHVSWKNQAVNGPVQGSAHQLLTCGQVNVRRKKEKYKVLGIPVMDVHDAMYFRVLVLELVKAYSKAKYLMEKESLDTVKSDFPHINWEVPIIVDGKAGIRLGCQVKLKDGFTVGGFLLDWFEACRKQVIELNKAFQAIKVS